MCRPARIWIPGGGGQSATALIAQRTGARSARRTSRGSHRTARVATSRPRNTAEVDRILAWCESGDRHSRWPGAASASIRSPDDVGEQDGREHAVELRLVVADLLQEALDLDEQSFRVAHEEEVVLAGQLDEPGTRDALGGPSHAFEWTPRELRHSFVSLLSSAGIPIEDIAHLVGHANTRTTEKVYRKELRPVCKTQREGDG